MHYHQEKSRAYVKTLGLLWDDEFAEQADEIALKVGLTQPQFDAVVRLYAWRVKVLFSPSTYTWRWRIALVCRFLNPWAE